MRGVFVSIVMLFAIGVVSAQEPFNGLITRMDGSGIRATVRVKGSSKWTKADGKGRFGLTDIEACDTLCLTYRRDTLVVAVEGRKSLHIVWAEEGEVYSSVKESEELANFGYGYVKRRESVDYSSGISGDRLRSVGCSSLLDALLICCPTLRYYNGELCLRTQNSINSSSAVLILCDGVETRLEYISLYDVKSVEVIKGPNMYGFRGVNGVVLISTMTAEDALSRKR